MYHPAGMRRAGPILILLIGVAALLIDFFPGLRLPDSTATDGAWRPVETKLGLDLEGGLRVEYQAQPKDGVQPTEEAMGVIKDIIERRVNTTGVSEPVVVVQGSDRVVIELPGITDVDAVRRLVGQTGQLDFVPLGSTTATKGQVLDLTQFPPLFGGDQIQSAAVGQDQQGGLAVTFVLKDDGPQSGAQLFAKHTAENIGRYFAVTLDGAVITAPSINDAIPNGQVQITAGGIGGFPAAEANEIVTVLKFGSLPFPIEELSSEQISATLGEQFLNQSLIAGGLGISLVILFMLLYYRMPGIVAAFALIYYTLVVLRHLPARAGDPDARRHRRLRPVDRHGGRRQHPHLRADEGRAAHREVAAGGGRGGLQPGLELDPRLERVEPHHGHDPVRVRVIGHPRLRARPHHRRPDLDVQRDRRHPLDHARHRPPGLGPRIRACSGSATTSSWPSPRAVRRAVPCVPMFDVIGKRRYFYLFSALLTIPGLFFILISPFSDAGLQLTIDYTGGTRWEIKFEDPSVTPAQVDGGVRRERSEGDRRPDPVRIPRDQDGADRPRRRAR